MTDRDDLADWLSLQRPSLQIQVKHLGGIDNPAIRPLLERQRERDAHGQTFAAEFTLAMRVRIRRDDELRAARVAKLAKLSDAASAPPTPATSRAARFARYSETLHEAAQRLPKPEQETGHDDDDD